MKISVLTLFPQMFDGFINTSIIKRALDKQVVEFEVIDIRPFAQNKHKSVDDTPYGGGQGMVMTCQPVVSAIEQVKKSSSKVYMMAPFGQKLTQPLVRELASEEHIVLLCGHYEGMDARIEAYCDGALSIGDYVLTGGELASMVISDAVFRTVEGAITQASHLEESFENDLLEHPHYTKPMVFEGVSVPEVLASGHHKNIERFRLKEALRRTLIHRPDMLEGREFNKLEKELMQEIQTEIEGIAGSLK